MTPDETIAQLRADIAANKQIEDTYHEAQQKYDVWAKCLERDLAREKERADKAEKQARVNDDDACAKAMHHNECRALVTALEKELAAGRDCFMARKLAELQELNRSLHGDLDRARKLSQSAETRLAALQGHADQMAKSWAYIAQKGTSLTKDDVMAGLATLRAYRAFTAEGQKK